jgi:patatin-like phospholipase/acyl hydrolase
MLSLDGGGVRGAISIAFLERLEKLIEEVEGRPTLLSDWFDFIGGTSTGAIIAGALALGFRAADVRTFITHWVPRYFAARSGGLRASCRNSTGKT